MGEESPRLPWNPAALYCHLYPLLVKAARAQGYTLAIHGSLSRDLDLIAVPWHPGARSAEDLVGALLRTVGQREPAGEPQARINGRVSYVLPLEGGAYIGLAVMLRDVDRKEGW